MYKEGSDIVLLIFRIQEQLWTILNRWVQR
jgi:hypothetical protein